MPATCWGSTRCTLRTSGRRRGSTTSASRRCPRCGCAAIGRPMSLPDLLPLLGAGRVKLAVWSGGADPLGLDHVAFDTMLARLQERHITPTACLLNLPPALARKLDESAGPTAAAAAEGDASWLRLL